MPKSIIIRRALTGGWCGYITPSPKMPTKDSVHQWGNFDTMVRSLKAMGIRVVVPSDELAAELRKNGVIAHKPVKER